VENLSGIPPDQVALWVCSLIALYATVRILLEPDTLRKLPFLNVFSFAISGIIALMIPHPLALAAAVAYFVGSTFESNAIASVYAGGIREDKSDE
jgi:energy-converting hydrogenase A subunit C